MKLPGSVCSPLEVLKLIILMKKNTTDKESGKKVLAAIHPLFTTYSRVRSIMEILCFTIDLDLDELCEHIRVTYPSFAIKSLEFHDALIQRPSNETIEKDTKKYILRFHSKYMGPFKTVQ
jgi:hypothetical protein